MGDFNLSFYGGVGSATGANICLEFKGKKILVDAGLKQGGRKEEEENFKDFVYEPSSIDFLLVTHAHMDHIGRIPKLVAAGFSGRIISTKETKELSLPMLEDEMRVLKQRHHKELFGMQDIQDSFALWEGFDYHKKIKLFDGVEVEMIDAGHILGSSIVVVSLETKDGTKRFAFTGDLGNSPSPLLKDTEIPEDIDYLVMESVYGDRNHEGRDTRRDELKETILDIQKRGGALVVPAFSIERTEVILYEINNMVEEGEVPAIPVFLDSPLALKVLHIYSKYSDDFNKSIKKEIAEGDDIFDFNGLKLISNIRDSEAIRKTDGAKIIIAGSGMSEGGRVLSHEAFYLSDPNSTVLLVGYQSSGSLGRRLEEGANEVFIEADGNKENGKERIEVRAKIKKISGYSSHKDSDNLVDFVDQIVNKSSETKLKKVFVIMGEPHSSLFLCQRLRDYIGVDAIYPEAGKEYRLN